MERNRLPSSSTLFLDRVGEVTLTVDSDGFSWKSVDTESNASNCMGQMLNLKTYKEIKFSDVYAVEDIGWGLIQNSIWDAGRFLPGRNSEMYRFVVHGFHRDKEPSRWVLAAYTFGHKDSQTCKGWVEQLDAHVNMEFGRPKSLLVFVHPLCGKGNGCKTWETVAPMFARAKVKTTVIVTNRAGHAYDMMAASTNKELSALAGVVVVGGDGLFNEILNGLLSSRHKIPYPPSPTEFSSAGNNDQESRNDSDSNERASTDDLNGDQEPLLPTSKSSGLENEHESCNTGQDITFSFPNDRFRLGIIPAGSTDAIVISTTGMRDPVTSALQIILGKKVSLDIAQVVRWKTSPSSVVLPSIRYAASFAGYGFYGDVVKESEKYRWMGPMRYDFAGTKVFLEHRSYEAEVAFLEDKKVDTLLVTDTSESQTHPSLISQNIPKRVICCKNCVVCNGSTNSSKIANGDICGPSVAVEDSMWSRSRGRFLSIGAAIISCRNERAPDGLVADAHLADGFLHLILVKDCSHPSYLWHLIRLTRRGTDPLNFEFVEHHKTPAFTFVSNHDKSAWNLDGELLQACQVSVQVCRGLINLFASGPEVQ